MNYFYLIHSNSYCFQSKIDGAEVTLTKAGPGGEQIVVTLNVNHTVDSAEPDDGQGEVL